MDELVVRGIPGLPEIAPGDDLPGGVGECADIHEVGLAVRVLPDVHIGTGQRLHLTNRQWQAFCPGQRWQQQKHQ